VDAAGNVYIAGSTGSSNFPLLQQFQVAHGYTSAFVAKMNAAGTALIYSTYLGGSNNEQAVGIAVDGSGSAYVTGSSSSSDFPLTPGTLRSSSSGGVFLTRLSPSGSSLLFSGKFGGSGNSDSPRALALDTAGNVYITGSAQSQDFPVTPGAFNSAPLQPAYFYSKVFVSKVGPTGTALLYSARFGGGNADSGAAIAVDTNGAAYVGGVTSSSDFPVTAGAFQSSPRSAYAQHGFVAKLSPAGDQLVFATYLGGSSSDSISGVAVDSALNVVVAGNTSSSDFPLTAAAFRSLPVGSSTGVFVTKLRNDATGLVFSSVFGGSGSNVATGVAVDGSGSVTVAGYTSGNGFPVPIGAIQSVSANRPLSPYCCSVGTAGFVSRLDSQGASLVYSTYLSGSTSDAIDALALDASGNAYVTGNTTSPDFPITPGAYRSFSPGQVLLAKIVHPSNCTFTIAPTSLTLGSAYAASTISVTTQAGCNWATALPATWIAAPSGGTGTGSGAVLLSIDQNLSVQRSATLSIAGNSVPVTQTNGCIYALAPASQSFTATGGSYSLSVQTASGCTFTASSNAAWLHNLSLSGNTVTYTVDANSTAVSRSGTLTVAGQTFTVIQGIAPCSFVVAPTTVSVPPNQTVTVSTDPTCAWSTLDTSSWVSAYQSTVGTGTVNVGAYGTAAFARSDTVIVAGQVVTANQAGILGLGIFRNPGIWAVDLSHKAAFDAGTRFYNFGLPGDQPVAGDWTGNGTTRIAVFRNGLWYVDLNGNGTWDGINGGDAIYGFGLPGDIAVVGDWNGDGRTKLGVFRCPASGVCTWIVDYAGKFVYDPATAKSYSYGLPGDIPFAFSMTYFAAQIGVFRCPAQGVCTWLRNTSGNGTYNPSDAQYSFGLAGDLPVVGNWNPSSSGSQIGVFRNGVWILDSNANGVYDASDMVAYFGLAGDRPVVGYWK